MEFVPWKHLSSLDLLQKDHSSIYAYLKKNRSGGCISRNPSHLQRSRIVVRACRQFATTSAPRSIDAEPKGTTGAESETFFLFKTIRLERLIDFMWMYEKLCLPGFHFSKLIK